MDPPLAFAALGDASRLAIVERLRRSPASVAVLAQGLPISRPAVSQHLRVLKDAGLVVDVAEGTRRVYQIDATGFAALRDWLEPYWNEALASFAAEVGRRQRRKTPP